MMQKRRKSSWRARSAAGSRLMNGLLNGKRIVVTAARGLGYHFAEACAAQGATVVMCDILQGELAESAHRLQRAGLSIESHAIDLADPHPSSRYSAPSARWGRSTAW
jgi:NAD(P)-dependent dehydrogenase (short-subunit alcohol dehydrogenase family)